MTAVDQFAGLGGWTEGAEQAGVRVLVAANHWTAARDAHQANHPDVRHELQDLRQADFTQWPRADILLTSPSCKGHTHARGKDRPHHDGERATAWAVVDYAECHLPPFIIAENVTEFLGWVLYPAWRLALQALGYAISPHIIDAADHGVPQHRTRVFIVCTRSKAPLTLSFESRPHVAASAILDPIAASTPLRRLCPATRARAARGRRAHGERFLMPYYRSGSGLTGRALARPLGTVTTSERWALVEGTRMRMLTVAEYRRAQSFPDHYVLPANKKVAVHLLGNAVPPVVARDFLNAIRAAA